jgi:hypothetical protein
MLFKRPAKPPSFAFVSAELGAGISAMFDRIIYRTRGDASSAQK